MRNEDQSILSAREKELNDIIEQERMHPHCLSGSILLVFTVIAAEMHGSIFLVLGSGEELLFLLFFGSLYLHVTVNVFLSSKRQIKQLKEELGKIKQRGAA